MIAKRQLRCVVIVFEESDGRAMRGKTPRICSDVRSQSSALPRLANYKPQRRR